MINENCIECGKPIGDSPNYLTEDGRIHLDFCQRYMVDQGRWPPKGIPKEEKRSFLKSLVSRLKTK